MKREVSAAVHFLKRLAVERGRLDTSKADVFAKKLQQLLHDKYDQHWYPDCPSKGQGFRCIRMNDVTPCDGAILEACEACQLAPGDLGLPRELTVWIDPLEVSARSGENCRPFTVARFVAGGEEEEEEVVEEEEEEEEVEEVEVEVEEAGSKRERGAVGSANRNTSDYHSATSSDCGSASCSDAEEEEGGRGALGAGRDTERADTQEAAAIGEGCAVTMVPRMRSRLPRRERPGKHKVCRNVLPASIQYYYHPAPVWPPFKKSAPVFLTTVCAPPQPPLFGYYIMHQPPQFIVPQASLQPWGR